MRREARHVGEMGRRTVTMAETMVSMTFAMAEMTALMAPPMSETMEPWVQYRREYVST